MAIDVTDALPSCRAIVLFALKREAEPLVWRFGLYPFWDADQGVYCLRTGLWDTAEPPAAGPGDVLISFTGLGPDAARAEAERVLSRFPRPPIIISAGICGGLRGGLETGDVVVPAVVGRADGREWRCAAIGMAQAGRLLTTEALVCDPADKRRLHEAHQADILDMEAAAVAEVCRARGVPFAAVKSVCDPVEVPLPRELTTIAPDGRVRFSRLIGSMLRRPALIPELMRLGRASRRAAWAVCEGVQRALDLVPDFQRG